jgi:Transposase IS66 family
MHAWTGGGPDLIWYGAAGDVPRPRSPGSGSWTATAGSWSATITAATSATTPGSPESSSAWRTCTGTLDDAYATDPQSQAWTPQAGDALRTAAAAVRAARDACQANLDPALLAGLRHSYDQAVACGICVNLSRLWHKGNHLGLILARRLKRKAAQVWLFATRFDVPATNNGSENAVRGYKLAAKISGCWRALSTLQRHCRIAPTSPPPAAVAATHSPPSAMPSPETPGCHRTQHDQLTGHP